MNITIKGITSVLPNNGGYMTKTGDVYIGGGNILSLDSAPEGFHAEKVIDGTDKLLVQGLVNAHTHAYMSLLRGSADDLSFNDWLCGRIEPLEDKLQPNDFYWGTMLGICEMIRSGTTSFLDMHMMPEKCALAAKESGIRAVLSRGLSGETRRDEGGLRRIRESKADIVQFADCKKISFMIAPHAPYSCEPKFLETVIETADDLNLGIHIHLSESEREVADIFKKYGCTPVHLMEKSGIFRLPCTAAHCVHLTENDMDILANKNVRAVTCPISNMKLGNGFAPVPELLEKGVTVALGTDGAASNNTLNMYRELSFLTLIHKGTHNNSQCISAEQGLKIASLNGAKALGLENTGEIRVGFAADLSILRLDSPSMNPKSNLVSALSYSDCSPSVETVIVGGDILMENYEIKTVDEQRVLFEANKIGSRLGI